MAPCETQEPFYGVSYQYLVLYCRIIEGTSPPSWADSKRSWRIITLSQNGQEGQDVALGEQLGADTPVWFKSPSFYQLRLPGADVAIKYTQQQHSGTKSVIQSLFFIIFYFCSGDNSFFSSCATRFNFFFCPMFAYVSIKLPWALFTRNWCQMRKPNKKPCIISLDRVSTKVLCFHPDTGIKPEVDNLSRSGFASS